MTRKRIVTTVFLVALGLTVSFGAARTAHEPQLSAESTPLGTRAQEESPALVAGPGQVEPISEEIALGAETAGRLAEMFVEEGDEIAAGEILARLESRDRQARLDEARARLNSAGAALRRLVNGAREQERREAQAALREAAVVRDNAQIRLTRRQELLKRQIVGQEEVDQAAREYDVASRRYDAAVEHESLVTAAPREEDLALAEANVALAQAQCDEAQAALDKATIRSPIRGVVLRVHRRAGEMVSDAPGAPLVTVADVSRLRVRVEIDEADVGQVRLGQSAYVTANAYPGQKFHGRVTHIGRSLGRKSVRTDGAAERVDSKVLEVLIDLDEPADLFVGLRVDAFVASAATGDPPAPPPPQ